MSDGPTRAAIRSHIVEILVTYLECNEAKCTDGARLEQDLGADDLDRDEFRLDAIDEFDIEITPDTFARIQTVKQFVDLVANAMSSARALEERRSRTERSHARATKQIDRGDGASAQAFVAAVREKKKSLQADAAFDIEDQEPPPHDEEEAPLESIEEIPPRVADAAKEAEKEKGAS